MSYLIEVTNVDNNGYLDIYGDTIGPKTQTNSNELLKKSKSIRQVIFILRTFQIKCFEYFEGSESPFKSAIWTKQLLMFVDIL